MSEVNSIALLLLFIFMITSKTSKENRVKKRIVIFASGSGTNTQNLIQHFQQSIFAEVVLVLSNKKDAKVLIRSKSLLVNSRHFKKEELFSSEGVLRLLKEVQADLIVLAGFLLKFPATILTEYPNQVINLHPALLPKYGGKGMYGHYVHDAVVANKEEETGITIHYVNENYDEGAIIFQKSVQLSEEDTPESVADKIHKLEYNYFPGVIEELILSEIEREKASKG
ncbi:MAG: phosphoribosylglycinamide formyltransferase-1 [Flavobacteriaceae bacterium]